MTEIPSPEDWERIGRRFRSIPQDSAYCAGARSMLLSLYNRGRTSGAVRFWRGVDYTRRNGQYVRRADGRYVTTVAYPGDNSVAFSRTVFFSSRAVAPHEGLHLWFAANPDSRFGNYDQLHAFMYAVDGEQCGVREG